MYNPHTEDLRVFLGKLTRYARSVEEFLAREATELEHRVESGMETQPSSNRQDYFESSLDDLIELSEDLPTILRNSVLTAADAAFEQMLQATCASHAKSIRSALTPHDLTGSILERTHAYLKKVAKISFPDDSPEWTVIRRLREFRNAIVHADGVIDSSRTVLLDWLSTQPGILLGPDNTVTINDTFVSVALGAYDSFAERFDAACSPLRLNWFLSGFADEDSSEAK